MAPSTPCGTSVASACRSLSEDTPPDAVVVQGDTTTSTAAAIAAFYRGIPVIHAEAGLRSFNLFSPFPEETAKLLAVFFVPLFFVLVRRRFPLKERPQ